MRTERLVPYLFLFPALAGIVVFKLYPIFVGLVQSLHTATFTASEKIFVGLNNYTMLFHDPVFWNSMKVTLVLNVLINPIQISLAFILALILNSTLKGIGIFRSIHYIPISISTPIAVIMWSVMFNPEQGVINTILVALGGQPQPFLGSESQALWVIILISTWKGVGYWAIFLLAGLQEVPKSLLESSSIDGASRWVQLKSIVFPLMKRPLVFVTVSCTVANFLLFSPMYLLTKGGPNNSTNVLMNESFNSAFIYSDMGRATSIVTMLLVVILTIIGLQFKLLKVEH